MNRTKFYKEETVDGVKELDFLNTPLSRFEVKRPVRYYRLTSIDRKRPDLLSYRFYATPAYWWVLCTVNGMDDPYFDTKIGRIISIPDIQDIYDFYKDYRVR